MFFKNRFINFAKSTPPAVPNPNAITPITNILSVSGVRNVSAVAVAPTDMPKRIVTIFISSFCTVLLSLSTTPLSRNRLPSISEPTSGAALGTSSATKSVTTIGNTIFSTFFTLRSGFITIMRSFFVVRARIIGG